MKKIIIIAIALLFSVTTLMQAQIGLMMGSKEKVLPFISTWETSAPSESITLPLLSSGGQYDFVVDWGDGSTEKITTNTASHSFATAGSQTITISGTINGWRFNYGGDKAKIRDISQWGCLQGAGKDAFLGCTNLQVSATDPLNTEGITDFSYQFAFCSSLTSLDVSVWDVSSGTNFIGQFYNCSSLTTLDVSGWDVSSGTNFSEQFGVCSSLTSLDVSGWDVSNGTNFSYQFTICTNLTSLDVSDWDVSSGTDFRYQFAICTNLTSLDVSGWDVSSGTNFSGQFYNCTNLTSLDVSVWDVSSGTNFSLQFYGCSSLTSLDVSGWDVSSGTNFISFMSFGPSMTTTTYNQTLINWKDKLQTVTGSPNIHFGGSKYNLAPHPAEAARDAIITKGWTITDGGGILPFISEWTTTASPQTITLPLSSSDDQYDFTVDWGDGSTEKITTNTASHSFATAGSQTITISGTINGWRFNYGGDKAKIRDISQWGCLQGAGKDAFLGCTNLQVSATDPLNTEGITDFSYQFAFCSSLTSLDVSVWDVSSGTNFIGQFYNCSSLTTLDVSGWDVSSGTNFSEQFGVCSSLTSLDVSGWDVSSGTNFSGQFYNCTNLTSLDVSVWDVSKGTNFSSQFYGCSDLNSLVVSSWDVGKGTDFSYQFRDCYNLTTLDVSDWDVDSGTNFQYQFASCWRLTSIDVSGWDVRSGTDFDFFMNGCPGMSKANYDQTLINWDALNLQPNKTIHFGNSKYSAAPSAAATARDNIENNDGWTITDGGGI